MCDRCHFDADQSGKQLFEPSSEACVVTKALLRTVPNESWDLCVRRGLAFGCLSHDVSERSQYASVDTDLSDACVTCC